MIIDINDQIQIVVEDPYNYVVKVKKVNKKESSPNFGEQTVKTLAYCQSLQLAIESVLIQGLSDLGDKGLEDSLKLVSEINSSLDKAREINGCVRADKTRIKEALDMFPKIPDNSNLVKIRALIQSACED